MEFSEVLKSLRKRRGLSQVKLADELGVSKSLIGYYETGERKPSFEALEDALGGSYLGAAIHSASDAPDRVAVLESALRRKRSTLCDAVKFVPFGGEVPAAFIVEREGEVRAFSLAAAYMRRGATQSDIRAALGV